MARYFFRRILWSVVIILAIATINFVVIKLVPGDPVYAMIGEYPAPPEYVEQIRREFGLDQPISVQLWRYLASLAGGDLGFSFVNRQPVLDLILDRAGSTLLLMAPAIFLSALLGIALAMVAAPRAGGALDNSITALTLIGYSAPVFWLGQILILVFVIGLGVLPASGMFSLRTPSTGWGVFKDLVWHMVLPVFCIVAWMVPVFLRTARVSIMSVVRSDFVLTARAKGLSERAVLWRHVLPNAIIPVIAVFGYQCGHALTNSLLVETVFSWPGVGQLFISSISQRDFPVLQGILLLSTIFVVLGNLGSDMLYAMVDPRVRHSLVTRHA